MLRMVPLPIPAKGRDGEARVASSSAAGGRKNVPPRSLANGEVAAPHGADGGVLFYPSLRINPRAARPARPNGRPQRRGLQAV